MMENKFIKSYLYFCITLLLSLVLLYYGFLMSFYNSIELILGYQSITLVAETSYLHIHMYVYAAVVLFIVILVFFGKHLVNIKQDSINETKEFLSKADQDDYHPTYTSYINSLYENKIFEYKNKYLLMKDQLDKERIRMNTYIENLIHQIKTPIMAIQLNEEIAEIKSDYEYLEENQRSFDRLINLINDIYNLSRISNEKDEMKLEKGSLSDFMTYVEERSYTLLQGIQYINHIEDTTMYYNELWLGECFFNIIKDCAEEDIHTLEIRSYSNQDMIHILIHDDGKGIDEDDLPYIFDRFYRSSHTDKQGMGIGLALAKEVVERHHGYIEAYNDHGAVFEIVLPIFHVKEKVKL